MGYTRYWERTNKAITEEFVKEVKTIIGDSLSKGIVICGWDGTGTPEITTEEISFNGNGSKDLDHETLFIGKETGFNFCKTACKPYDYTVSVKSSFERRIDCQSVRRWYKRRDYI